MACDVGQGDGLVLNAGSGRAVVVDVGPDATLIDRCLDRLEVDRVADPDRVARGDPARMTLTVRNTSRLRAASLVAADRCGGLDVPVPLLRLRPGKAHGLAEPTGFVKLVADAKYNELLGGHLIGPDVSELLPELTLAQKWDLTANELARNVHTHPTLSEAVQRPKMVG